MRFLQVTLFSRPDPLEFVHQLRDSLMRTDPAVFLRAISRGMWSEGLIVSEPSGLAARQLRGKTPGREAYSF